MMPRLRTKPKKAEPEPKRFKFELAACVEAFRLGSRRKSREGESGQRIIGLSLGIPSTGVCSARDQTKRRCRPECRPGSALRMGLTKGHPARSADESGTAVVAPLIAVATRSIGSES